MTSKMQAHAYNFTFHSKLEKQKTLFVLKNSICDRFGFAVETPQNYKAFRDGAVVLWSPWLCANMQ